MKRYFLIPILFLVAAIGFAESVWTGNAAVGTISDFPGDSEIYRASSNSFPPGTRLVVTNPRGGRSVDVTVIGRLDSPGVFILLEIQAGENIGLPVDHVVPVRVSPLENNAGAGIPGVAGEEGGLTEDTDFNPAASIDETDEELRIVETPEPELEVESEPEPESVVVSTSDTEPLAEDLIEPEAIEPEAENSETIYTYEYPDDGDIVEESLVQEDPDDEILNDEVVTDSDGNSMFFLMPTDPRPPEVTEEPFTDDPATEMVEADQSEADSTELSYPVAETELARVDARVSGSYVQIGAYQSMAVMLEAAARIGVAAPGYPLSYTEIRSGSSQIYKLLIGPLSPAEVGIVLQTARNTAFPDAFPYAP